MPADRPARPRPSPALLLGTLLLACAHALRATPPRPPVSIRLLGINDFHGQLDPVTIREGRRTPGAAVFAARLRAARDEHPGATLVLSAGDLFGNSPPLSAVLQDEPTVAVLNALAGSACQFTAPERRTDRTDLTALAGDPRCDVVAVPGNHELEEGLAELARVTRGGDRARGPSLATPWRGARFPFVAANVVDRASGEPAFPPSVVREVGGVKVGVVGAVLTEVPEMLDPGKVDDLGFLAVAGAVNAAVRDLVGRGVRAVVLVLHDGGMQDPYQGPTRTDAPPVAGPIAALVAHLDGEVDVVVSGHYHAFSNARLPNAAGRDVLVTQALSAGSAFSRIDLGIDPDTGDVVAASAEIVPVEVDGPEDPQVAAIVTAARRAAAPLFDRVIARANQPLRRGRPRLETTDSGEWPLGDLVADASRAAMKADIGLVQMAALRADIPAGAITWGHLYSALPLGDTLVRVALTGREIRAALEQQWMPEPRPSWRPEPYVLQVSGLVVAWDPTPPQGEHIVELAHDGKPLGPDDRFTVAMPRALADGTDRFPCLATAGRERVDGPAVIDAVEAHLASLPQPVVPPPLDRISRRR